MADVLSLIRQRDQRNQEDALVGALKDATWASTFQSIPDAEKLRAQRNLTDMVDQAYQRKMDLAAQGDTRALDLQRKAYEFKEYQAQAPLREALLKNRIESAGAHDRFLADKDSKSMEDLSGFFSYMDRAPKVGTPEYKSYLNNGISRFPRIIGTQAGLDALKNLQREHEDISSMTPPAGMQLDRMDFDENGKAKAVFKPIPPEVPETPLPDGMVPSSATRNKHGDLSVTYRPPTQEKTKTEKQDTYEAFNRDLKAAQIAHGVIDEKGQPKLSNDGKTPVKLPDTLQQAFEQRGRVLQHSNEFMDANAVKAALRANTIDRATAEAVLRSKFGFQ